MDDIDIQISEALARSMPRLTATPDWQDVLRRSRPAPLPTADAPPLRTELPAPPPAPVFARRAGLRDEQGWGTRPIRRRQMAVRRRAPEIELQASGWGTRPL